MKAALQKKIRSFHSISKQRLNAKVKKDGVSHEAMYETLAIPYYESVIDSKATLKAEKKAKDQASGKTALRNLKRKAAYALKVEQTTRDAAAAIVRQLEISRVNEEAKTLARQIAKRNRAYLRDVLKKPKADENASIAQNIVKQVNRYSLVVRNSAMLQGKNRAKSFLRPLTYHSTITEEQYLDLQKHGKLSDVFLTPSNIHKAVWAGESFVEDYEEIDPGSYETRLLDDEPTPLEHIPMRDSGTLLVDGEGQPWDTLTHRCVFDYLIWKFGGQKGFIKLVDGRKGQPKYESLKTFFNSCLGWTSTDFDALRDGVSVAMLCEFCEKVEMTFVAYNADDKAFVSHFAPGGDDRKHSRCLLCRIVNGHFYAIEGRSEVASRTQINQGKSDMLKGPAKKVAKKRGEKKKVKSEFQLHYVEKETHPMQYFWNMCKKLKAIPGLNSGASNIYYTKHTIGNFSIGKTMYYINQDIQGTINLCHNMGLEFKGQSKSQLMFKIISDIGRAPGVSDENWKGFKIRKSVMNPDVFDSLAVAGVKARAHYGCENGFTSEHLEELRDGDRLSCADICKCYASMLYLCTHDWPLFVFTDQWAPFDDDFHACGLYKVLTNDFEVMHGNSIYFTSMLEHAEEEGISFTVVEQLKAKHNLPAGFFKPILEAFWGVSKGDTNVFKSLFQPFTGYLGKQTMQNCSVKVSNCDSQIMNHLKLACPSHLTATTAILETVGDYDDKTYMMYGEKKTTILVEHNLPIWIAMHDHADVRLSVMINQMCDQGGTVAFRNTDCAVVVDGRLPTLESDEVEGIADWGKFRSCSLPKKLGQNSRDSGSFIDIAFPPQSPFVFLPFHDSDEWEAIAKAFIANEGGLLQGRAGTGKTYVLEEIVKILEALGLKVAKVAFTNKAARNIGGQTIHTFLSMDTDNLISEFGLSRLGAFDFVIVDELSMVPGMLIRALCLLKRLSHSKFILVGDLRQTPPVKETVLSDYFDHASVRYLANNVRVELDVPHRYDMDLWNILEEITDDKPFDSIGVFGTSSVFTNRFNITYSNRKRAALNHLWMRREAPVDALFFEALNDADKFKYNQAMWVYPGMPIMAVKTIRKDHIIKYANSDTFTVISVGADCIVCLVTTKALTFKKNEKGEKIKLPDVNLDIPREDFHKHMVPNYASTTHKSQGDTIEVPFTIWEYGAMTTKLRYTAVSRGVNIPNITLGLPTSDDLKFESDLKFEAATMIPVILKTKIAGHRAYDRKHAFYGGIFVTVSHVLGLHNTQKGECARCKLRMKLKWDIPNDARQLSIDREDDGQGHIEGNVVLTCWGCNREHSNNKSPLD